MGVPRRTQQSKIKRFTFDHLPNELLLHIFAYLDDNSKISCKRVCHRWLDLLNTINIDKLVLRHIYITENHPIITKILNSRNQFKKLVLCGVKVSRFTNLRTLWIHLGKTVTEMEVIKGDQSFIIDHLHLFVKLTSLHVDNIKHWYGCRYPKVTTIKTLSTNWWQSGPINNALASLPSVRELKAPRLTQLVVDYDFLDFAHFCNRLHLLKTSGFSESFFQFETYQPTHIRFDESPTHLSRNTMNRAIEEYKDLKSYDAIYMFNKLPNKRVDICRELYMSAHDVKNSPMSYYLSVLKNFTALKRLDLQVHAKGCYFAHRAVKITATELILDLRSECKLCLKSLLESCWKVTSLDIMISPTSDLFRVIAQFQNQYSSFTYRTQPIRRLLTWGHNLQDPEEPPKECCAISPYDPEEELEEKFQLLPNMTRLEMTLKNAFYSEWAVATYIYLTKIQHLEFYFNFDRHPHKSMMGSAIFKLYKNTAGYYPNLKSITITAKCKSVFTMDDMIERSPKNIQRIQFCLHSLLVDRETVQTFQVKLIKFFMEFPKLEVFETKSFYFSRSDIQAHVAAFGQRYSNDCYLYDEIKGALRRMNKFNSKGYY